MIDLLLQEFRWLTVVVSSRPRTPRRVRKFASLRTLPGALPSFRFFVGPHIPPLLSCYKHTYDAIYAILNSLPTFLSQFTRRIGGRLDDGIGCVWPQVRALQPRNIFWGLRSCGSETRHIHLLPLQRAA